MTPPIDQRPSSSLLSFLQLVNFSNSRVEVSRAAPALHFMRWDFGASGPTSREDTLLPRFSFLETAFHGVFVEIIYCHRSGEVRKHFYCSALQMSRLTADSDTDCEANTRVDPYESVTDYETLSRNQINSPKVYCEFFFFFFHFSPQCGFTFTVVYVAFAACMEMSCTLIELWRVHDLHHICVLLFSAGC